MAAVNAFFQQTYEVADVSPERVFTDGHNESIRTEISRFVIAKESLDKALKMLILRSA